MSVNFLEKNVKNLEKAIYPLVIGKPVIILGDRPSTKIITRTLLLFTQHLSAEVIDWLVSENQIGLNITGMSKERYNELKKKNYRLFFLLFFLSGTMPSIGILCKQ